MATADYVDPLIRHVLMVQRVAAGFSQELQKRLSARERRVLDRLGKYATRGRPLRERERKALLKYVRELDAVFAREFQEGFGAALLEVAQTEAQWTASALVTYLGAETQRKVRASRALVRRSLEQAYGDERVRGTINQTIRATLGSNSVRTTTAIQRAYREGRTIAQLSRDVRTSTDVTRRETDMVARTAMNTVTNEVRNQTYALHADLISHLVWVSTLDDRTSAYCRHMDGVELPLDSGPRPPGHPNCRSTTVPILEGETTESALSGRASLGSDTARNRRSLERATERPGDRVAGRTKTYADYETFLARQSAAFQDEVLGPTRGRAFRRGEVSFDELAHTTREGYFKRPATVAELGLTT